MELETGGASLMQRAGLPGNQCTNNSARSRRPDGLCILVPSVWRLTTPQQVCKQEAGGCRMLTSFSQWWGAELLFTMYCWCSCNYQALWKNAPHSGPTTSPWVWPRKQTAAQMFSAQWWRAACIIHLWASASELAESTEGTAVVPRPPAATQTTAKLQGAVGRKPDRETGRHFF